MADKLCFDITSTPAAISADALESALRRCADGGMVRARSIGHSRCGRSIMALEIGSTYQPALIVGGTHGMEWASVAVALRLAMQTVAAVRSQQPVHGADLFDLLAGRGVVIVPLLNPDGYELRRQGAAGALGARRMGRHSAGDFRYWQANAAGVDINHNFDAGFYKAARAVAERGIRGPGPTRYGGLFPFSEPESRAIRKLCAYLRPRTLYALHSQGEEIYWRYGNEIPEGSEYIAKLLASLTGYKLCEPDALASHAGLKDWFIKAYRRPGFTIELGSGMNPLPYEDFELIWQRVERAMFVSLMV